MAIGLIGRKCGMTRIFTDAGESVPVTVVEVLPNRVTQVKSVETDDDAMAILDTEPEQHRRPRQPSE